MPKYLTAVDENSDELMHYGVLGMKWHHRKAGNYYGKKSMYESWATSSKTKAGQRYFNKRAKKYSEKSKAELEKNKQNIKTTGKGNVKDTRLTTASKARGVGNALAKYTAKSMLATTAAATGAGLMYSYGSARKAGYSRKESAQNAKRTAQYFHTAANAAAKDFTAGVGKYTRPVAETIRNATSSYTAKKTYKRNVKRAATKYGLPGPVQKVYYTRAKAK